MGKTGEIRFIGIVDKEGEQEAQIRVFPEFCAGLKGMEGYSHIIILYWFHQRDDEKNRQTLLVYPRRHAANVEAGVFACRSPSRPNPIGLCIAQLLKIEGCVLTVKGLDAFKGSPIVDIKPYVPRADSFQKVLVPEWADYGPPT
jgi:tRNA-Thr(GGU) m(6)t(6)A37 methyltransferase TsaA